MSDDENDYSLYGSDKLYYKMLLRNNYISDLSKTNFDNILQMEHSYSRDWRPMEGVQVMTTKTIMVHKPPPCPSCHNHSHDEIGVDMHEPHNPPIPAYNEEAARIAMEECEKAAQNVRTSSVDDEDWEERVKKIGWTIYQNTLYSSVARILDLDHMARLANYGREHEPVLRRVIIDKSVARMRKALAKISWDVRLTQWIHGLLMDHLPPSYMASYLDILQTLKSKVPTLVDKMMFGRPISVNQDILGPVLKKPWEPCVAHKNRKLPGQAIIVIVPSSPVMSASSPRLQRWYSLFATMANVVPIQMNISGTLMQNHSLASITEQLITISRAKVQEIRNEAPNRHIILVGLNAGASLALQVALVEPVNSIICMGFAYNTLNGVRGAPDDRILDLTTPVLFALGQNSARSSQEEIESLREKMQAQTSLVVVGSADDALRVSKSKRQIEGVTQNMVDNMIMDEISEFASSCIINPPAPRDLSSNNGAVQSKKFGSEQRDVPTKMAAADSNYVKKRKSDGDAITPVKKARMIDTSNGKNKSSTTPRKVGRPRIHPPASPKRPKNLNLLAQPTSEALNTAIQSILPPTKPAYKETKLVSAVPAAAPAPPTTKPPITIEGNVNFVGSSGSNKMPTISQSTTATIIPSTPINKTIMVPMIQKQLQKVKIIQPNQFVQIRPPIQNNQKLFSFKSSSPLPPPVSITTKPAATTTAQNSQYTIRAAQPQITGNSTSTSPSNKVFTLKSTPTGTQLLSSLQIKPMQPKVSSAPLIISPAKYTIVKPVTLASSAASTINRLVTTQATINRISTPTTTTRLAKTTPDLSTTNIFDIPIVFADNDGNIQESAPITSMPLPPPVTQSQPQVIPNRFIINTINGPKLHNLTTANKMVVVNRHGQVKAAPPSTNFISRPLPPLKYTKVLPSTFNLQKSSDLIKPTTISISAAGSPPFKSAIPQSKKIEIVNNSIIKSAPITMTLNTTSAPTPPITKYQPIVINVDSEKTTIKNMIKVGGSDAQIKPSPNTIVIKPSDLRTIPMLKPGILNRNLTVRKVVNLIPQKSLSSTSIGTIISSASTLTVSPTSSLISSAGGSGSAGPIVTNLTKKIINIVPSKAKD